jgi:hypothetical protein
MAEDILDGLADATPQTVALEERVRQVIDNLTNGSKALLLNLIQQRTQLYNLFWNGGNNVNPMTLASRLGPAKTYSLFKRAAALGEFIAGQLADAGVPPDKIAAFVPGVPDTYTVKVDDEAKTVMIEPVK